MQNFALAGVAGYIAPRHLQAIKAVGGDLIAAVDPNDSVGILDRYFPDAPFFTEFERFDRYVEKLRRGPAEKRLNYLSICSPNYLHDAHIRYALRIGAHAICEKPLVLKPWNLDALEELESETGGKVSVILQLRLHPALIALKKELESQQQKKKAEVVLSYITPRGPWYHYSWKGTAEKSGGLALNIGIHFFDLLMWLFGRSEMSVVHAADSKRTAGFLELERATVRWFLSIDRNDLPTAYNPDSPTFRSITIDGKELEFSEGFTDLHTRMYEEITQGRGFGIKDARPSLQLVHNIRNAKTSTEGLLHPFLESGRTPR